MHTSDNKTRCPNVLLTSRKRGYAVGEEYDEVQGKMRGREWKESRSRFVIHIRVSEDKAIKSPRASGVTRARARAWACLDFRVELNLQIRQAHKEANRHGEIMGGVEGRSCRIKWKENIVFFMRVCWGKQVWGKLVRGNEVDGPPRKRGGKMGSKVAPERKIKVVMCRQFAKRG